MGRVVRASEVATPRADSACRGLAHGSVVPHLSSEAFLLLLLMLRRDYTVVLTCFEMIF